MLHRPAPSGLLRRREYRSPGESRQELNAEGHSAETFFVMSGYRTPAYNRAIHNVRNSRHIYGDAADIFVDEDGNGRMDDLNGDEGVDLGDVDVLAKWGNLALAPPSRECAGSALRRRNTGAVG